jgi:desulfoferrodoxin (superoxide reductase-like protein)
MKKIILTGLVLAFGLAFVKADPAKKVMLSFDKSTNKLKIVAEHPVKNVNDHYIDLINISVDGKDVKEIKLKKQSSPENETLEIVLPEIKQGSKVEVKTRCNQFGKKSGKLEVK